MEKESFKTISLSEEELNRAVNKTKPNYVFSKDPKRYDYIIDKIVPFMVQDPIKWEKLAEYSLEEEEMNDFREWKRLDKEYFVRRLRERYEQYLYCFFPDKYDKYISRINRQNIAEEKNNALYETNKHYNDRNYTYLG